MINSSPIYGTIFGKLVSQLLIYFDSSIEKLISSLTVESLSNNSSFWLPSGIYKLIKNVKYDLN